MELIFEGIRILLDIIKISLGIFIFIQLKKLIKLAIPYFLEASENLKLVATDVHEMRPININSMPVSELAKEVKRRQILMAKFMEGLSNVVAAGVGKAFKKR